MHPVQSGGGLQHGPAIGMPCRQGVETLPEVDQRIGGDLPMPSLIPFRTYCVVSILSHHPTLMLVEYCWCSSLPRHRTTMDSRPGAGAWRGSANRAEGLR